ncbi:hypothetical protein [Pontibacter indicus]|uniref:Uncharacterized protein n=1 Tax=Pontibacter indicus TaxID=1317125 RepID=A0A1R3XNS4_9BACT|nr:hypothetical protein [Pontibacter indicus]SIT92254.1 hypothetical protein SAMN05444128_2778 [Pontibacter indicus]
MKTLLLLTLTTLISLAQSTGNYQIEITSTASASHSQFKIYVLKSGDTTKILYSKRKEGELKPTKEDSLKIEELAKTFDDPETRKQLIQIIEKYEVFEKDSLIISSNHPLLHLSDSLSKEKTLTVDEQNKNRIVLDGTRAVVKVKHENMPAYELYAVSPQKDTHPLLYQFITSALELYRSNAEKPILNKSDTQGY